MILRKIERYLREKDIAPTRFGRDVMSDPRFVLDLRRGREPSEASIKKIEKYFTSRNFK